MLSWGLLLSSLLLPVTHIQPVAEQTWLEVSREALTYPPAPAALSLEWQGQRLDAKQVEQTDTGWRILFRERLHPPFALYLDPSMPPGQVEPAPQPSVACVRTVQPGETLWRIAGQLAAIQGEEPYLMLLALFAANRDRLDNNPERVRSGLRLVCPDARYLAHFRAMSLAERKQTYRRLEAYGQRLSR